MEKFFRNKLTTSKLNVNNYKIRILLIIIPLLFFQPGFSQKRTGKISNKPNVLFILIDDLGWKDVGPYGSTFYDTPNIDELAKQSIKFTNAYAACPVCSPSRAAIMTGKYPAQLQLTDWLGAKQPEDELKETRPDKIKPLLPAPYKTYLPLEEFTVAEAFKKDSYKTFIAGKWHLSDKNKSTPTQQGFDQYYEGNARHASKGVFELAKEVNSFITDHQHDPFFVYFATYSVHIPLLAAEEDIDKYKKKRAASGLTEEFETTSSGKTRIVQGNPAYAATVYEMDQAVGSVLDKLKELGLEDNTIVIFASDNGGVATAQGWPTSNSPLRGGKGWMYEGGIRIPLMVKWPGVSKPGTTNDVPVMETDIYPTLLEATHQPLINSQHTAGLSFVPLIKNKPYSPRPLFFHYPHYGDQGGAPASAVRDGDWKLIHWYINDRYELFNLKQDIGEKNNLYDSNPSISNRLKKELNTWLSKVGAKYPQKNPNYVK